MNLFGKKCQSCKQKIGSNEGWSKFYDPNKQSGLPEGYYHLKCKPKIQHNYEDLL